jgi:hypothetical protein
MTAYPLLGEIGTDIDKSRPKGGGAVVERLFSGYVRHVAYRRGSAVTSKAEEYRAKALECEARAEQTRDPFIKQQMIDIAEKWRTMAAYEEKHSR